MRTDRHCITNMTTIENWIRDRIVCTRQWCNFRLGYVKYKLSWIQSRANLKCKKCRALQWKRNNTTMMKYTTPNTRLLVQNELGIYIELQLDIQCTCTYSFNDIQALFHNSIDFSIIIGNNWLFVDFQFNRMELHLNCVK